MIRLIDFLNGIFGRFYDRMTEIFRDIKRGNDIDYCEDDQLKQIAYKVGARVSTTDDSILRQYIKGRIVAKNSDGYPQDMDAIIKIMSNDTGYVKEYIKTIEFWADINEIIAPEICLEYIRLAKPLGVNVNGIILEDSNDFILSESDMEAVGDSGDTLADMVF